MTLLNKYMLFQHITAKVSLFFACYQQILQAWPLDSSVSENNDIVILNYSKAIYLAHAFNRCETFFFMQLATLSEYQYN